MVSVVRFAVNYFAEPFFFAGFYLQGLQHWCSWERGGSRFQESWGPKLNHVADVYQQQFFSPACHFTRIAGRVYTHFICTHGTQINYKCEPSSKQLSGHLFCSLWSHLLSLPLNHTCLCERILLHFKHYTLQMGLCTEIIFHSFVFLAHFWVSLCVGGFI